MDGLIDQLIALFLPIKRFLFNILSFSPSFLCFLQILQIVQFSCFATHICQILKYCKKCQF